MTVFYLNKNERQYEIQENPKGFLSLIMKKFLGPLKIKSIHFLCIVGFFFSVETVTIWETIYIIFFYEFKNIRPHTKRSGKSINITYYK